jgi:teichuronic acid biosynthesis glycosyltransferase TuaG
MQLISIIMPYYRKIDTVNRSIKSVVNQTYKKFELIIIYDDNDLEEYYKIKNFIKNNKKIKLIKNKKNIGAGKSRNIGIKNCNGNIITFIDSDDTWHPQKLRKQLNFLDKNNYNFIFCGYKKILKKKSIKVTTKSKYLDYKDLLKSCEIGLSTVMIRKKIINNELFTNLKTQEDLAAWLKITKKHKAFFLDEILVNWYQTKNSLSSNFFQKICDAFKVFYFHQKLSLFRSFYYLIILSTNSIKRKF